MNLILVIHDFAFAEAEKSKLARKDTPRPKDLMKRINMKNGNDNAFDEEDEECFEEEDENEIENNDDDKDVITEQKTITKVYEEVFTQFILFLCQPEVFIYCFFQIQSRNALTE